MPEALTYTRITWALSPTAPQVHGVTPGSSLCPWCFMHSSWRGARHLACKGVIGVLPATKLFTHLGLVWDRKLDRVGVCYYGLYKGGCSNKQFWDLVWGGRQIGREA